MRKRVIYRKKPIFLKLAPNTALLYCAPPYTTSYVSNEIEGYAAKSENPQETRSFGGTYHEQQLVLLYGDGGATSTRIPAMRIKPTSGTYDVNSWCIRR